MNLDDLWILWNIHEKMFKDAQLPLSEDAIKNKYQ